LTNRALIVKENIGIEKISKKYIFDIIKLK